MESVGFSGETWAGDTEGFKRLAHIIVEADKHEVYGQVGGWTLWQDFWLQLVAKGLLGKSVFAHMAFS